MRLLSFLCIAALAAAQTTSYPTAVDTDSTLFVTRDNVQSTLSLAVAAGDNVLIVANGTGFAANQIATICDTIVSGKCTAWEHMLITSVAGQALTVTRAYAGTSATSHAAGKTVAILIDSAHQKVLKDAIIAIETALGANLSRVGLGSFYNVKSYGALGNGSADDTSAIQAAITAATASGGIVLMPPGTYNITAALHIPSKVTLAGSGQENTTIYLPNGALAANGNWQITGVASQYCVICMDPGTSYQRIRDFTVNSNGANQTWFYYTEIFGYNASNVIVDRVTVKNHTISGGTGTSFQFLGHSPKSSNANNVIQNSTSIGIANCLVPNGGGAFYIEGEGTRVLSSYAKDFCDSPFVMSQCDHCVIADSVADVGTGQMATPTFSIEGANYSTFSNDQCVGTGTNGHRFCVGLASINNAAGNVISTGNKVINVSSSHLSTMLAIGQGNPGLGSTDAVKDTEVVGLYATGAALDCVLLQQYVDGVKFIGGSLTNCGGLGISIGSTGSTAVVKNVYIDGLRIDHANNRGIVALNSTSGPPVQGITIKNSWIGDSSGSPIQQYGILLTAGLVTDADISHNIFVGNTTAPVYYQNTFARAILGPNSTDKADSLIPASTIGAAVASAGTITPTGEVFHVTGTTAINTINTTGLMGTSYVGCIRMIPDAAFTTTTAGNIALASTAVVGKTLTMCYDGSAAAGAGRWYPSY